MTNPYRLYLLDPEEIRPLVGHDEDVMATEIAMSIWNGGVAFQTVQAILRTCRINISASREAGNHEESLMFEQQMLMRELALRRFWHMCAGIGRPETPYIIREVEDQC